MHLILLVIPLLLLLIVIAFMLFIFKKWKAGIVYLAVALVLNYFTQQVPLSPLNLIKTTSFTQSDVGQSTLSVLSHNVHGIGEGFDQKAEEFEKLIVNNHPDIVYLTEYYENNSPELDNKLKNHFSNTYLEWGNGERLYTNWRIIGAKHLKVEMRDDYSENIKKTINTSWIYRFVVAKDTAETDSLKNNIFDMSHEGYFDDVWDRTGKDSVVVYVCHLETNNYAAVRDSISERGLHLAKYLDTFIDHTRQGYETRKLEADCLYESIMSETCKDIIVMGDFNDINGSYTLTHLAETGLQDAWWHGGFGLGCTFHSYHLYLRLDHILYSPSLSLENVKVLDSDLSDHNAIQGTFKFSQLIGCTPLD